MYNMAVRPILSSPTYFICIFAALITGSLVIMALLLLMLFFSRQTVYF